MRRHFLGWKLLHFVYINSYCGWDTKNIFLQIASSNWFFLYWCCRILIEKSHWGRNKSGCHFADMWVLQARWLLGVALLLLLTIMVSLLDSNIAVNEVTPQCLALWCRDNMGHLCLHTGLRHQINLAWTHWNIGYPMIFGLAGESHSSVWLPQINHGTKQTLGCHLLRTTDQCSAIYGTTFWKETSMNILWEIFVSGNFCAMFYIKQNANLWMKYN